MSGTTTSSGTPISALPLASSVAATDTIVGVVSSGGTVQAEQVPVSVLASGIAQAIGLDDAVTAAQTAAEQAATENQAAGQAAANAVSAKIGKAGGAAALDNSGHLALTDGTALVSVASVEPATATTPAILVPDIPISEKTLVGSTGKSFSDLIEREDQLPSGTYFVDQSGAVLRADTVGTLPTDVTLNGGVYMAGATALPAGLSVDPATGMILTDGTTYYPNTINNVGVLCAAAE